MTWDPQYKLPPQIGRPVPPRRVGVPPRPAAARQAARKYTPQQARLAGASCLAVIVFAVICSLTHSSPPASPAYGGSTSGPVQMYPHSPKVAAAAIGAEARAAGHVAGGAARMAGRMVIMRGLRGGLGGGTFRGYGFSGFGGGGDTPGGFGFGGFGFGGF